MGYALGWPAWGEDASSFAADTEAAGFPAANLENGRVYSRTRSTTTSVQYDLDLGAQRAIGVVFCAGVNWTTAATWRVRTSDDATFVSGVYDSTTVDVWATQVATHISPTTPWGRVAVHVLSSEVTDRYVRINVTDAGNADGYIATGVIDAAQLWEPGRSFGFGWQLARERVGADRHARYARVLEHELLALTEAEGFSLDLIQQAIGEQERPVLVLPRVDRTDLVLLEALYAKLGALTQIRRPDVTRHAASMRWVEVTE